MEIDVVGASRGKGVSAGKGQALLLRYWVAQVLSTPAVWRKGWCKYNQRFENDELLELMKLLPSREAKLRKPPKALEEYIRSHPLDKLLLSDDVYRNIKRLGERLSLSETECRLLTFLGHMQCNNLLYQACLLVQECPSRVLEDLLARVIDVPTDELHQVLRPEGVLRASGMLKLSFNLRGGGDLTDMVEVDRELYELMQAHEVSDAALVSLFYRGSDPATLTEDDYVELADEVSMLKRALSKSLAQQRAGINILFYGPPGTGKTELTRVLANSLGCTLAMVSETDREGDGLEALARMGRYNACQRALANDKETLVVFDEAEDCLCDAPMSFFSAPRKTPKAGVIRFLESNPRPTIWISNRVEMDPAFLRRFTHAVLLDNPGPAQRRRLVTAALDGMPVSEHFIDALAAIEQMSPAILRASVEFAELAGESAADGERLVGHSMNALLKAMGRDDRLRAEAHAGLPWRAECLRASEDVASLMKEVRADVPVRFCLYGPPGTGKTAWAQQLADTLNRPLITRQASDLLGKYVGETEKQIAAAFQEAEREGAVLLIDEADSFIGSRHNARQSWEVSQVNQFLASLERYQGIFVATTNLYENLDEAAMRRFDFSISFDFLSLDGTCVLIKDLAHAYGIALPEENDLRVSLRELTQLAPGDFALLFRRLRVRKALPDAAGLIAMLRELCASKKGPARSIGFQASLH